MGISINGLIVDLLGESARARSTTEILNICSSAYGVTITPRELKRALHEALREGQIKKIVRFVPTPQNNTARRTRVKETLWQID